MTQDAPSATCPLCGEDRHKPSECPAYLSYADTRSLLLTTRKALADVLLAIYSYEPGNVHRISAAGEARRVLEVLKK